MNASRPTRTTMTLSLCIAALASALWYQHSQISLLDERITASTNSESLDELLLKVREVDDRMGQVEIKNLVSNDDFRASQQALSNRIDAAQKLAEQVSETGQDILLNTASASDLLALKADVTTIEKQLHDLSKAQSKPSPAATAKSKPNTTAQKLIPVTTPPFTVVGIEYRGGEQFLAVGPPESTQLSQIYLIQPGDTVAGTTWRLKALEGHSARFDVAGTTHVVPLER